ncbi:MAG: hypothetical protein HOH14_06300 [Gammaproteobacteria bacterium]|jgi:hypothetical protein|nr:hypothetical protein [Gammaproteobacteria bacterium]MBT6043085.1 hypothetical protein [Gammaproteobacteria bacterium]
MSNQNSIHDTIAQASKEIYADASDRQEKSNRPGKKQAYRLSVMILIILVLLIAKIFLDTTVRQLESDMSVSALDLFMEADASVVIYYQQTGSLPDELPEAALSSIVEYNRLDEDRYSLKVLLPPHDTVIERSAQAMAPPTNTAQLLGL